MKKYLFLSLALLVILLSSCASIGIGVKGKPVKPVVMTGDGISPMVIPAPDTALQVPVVRPSLERYAPERFAPAPIKVQDDQDFLLLWGLDRSGYSYENLTLPSDGLDEEVGSTVNGVLIVPIGTSILVEESNASCFGTLHWYSPNLSSSRAFSGMVWATMPRGAIDFTTQETGMPLPPSFLQNYSEVIQGGDTVLTVQQATYTDYLTSQVQYIGFSGEISLATYSGKTPDGVKYEEERANLTKLSFVELDSVQSVAIMQQTQKNIRDRSRQLDQQRKRRKGQADRAGDYIHRKIKENRNNR